MRMDVRVKLMRWGFHRSFNPSINNAREDKLDGGIWRESFHERRCVIPMTTTFGRWHLGGKPGARPVLHDSTNSMSVVTGVAGR